MQLDSGYRCQADNNTCGSRMNMNHYYVTAPDGATTVEQILCLAHVLDLTDAGYRVQAVGPLRVAD